MTAIPGCDYSVARPSPTSLANAKIKFACRYLRDLDKSNGDKSLTVAEVTELQHAGLTIVSNEETDGRQGLTGITGGRADAGAANIAHLAAGGPPDRPIYFSPWDHDPALLRPDQRDSLWQYMLGAGQVLGRERLGLYAGVELISAMFDDGLISYGWEAAGWRKGRAIDARSHIVQHIGQIAADVDSDTALKLDYGQWDFKPEGWTLQLDSDDQAFVVKTVHTQLQHALMLILAGRTGSIFNGTDLERFHYDEFKPNTEIEAGLANVLTTLANIPQMVVAALPANTSGTFTLEQVQGACEQAVRNVFSDASTPDPTGTN